MSSITNLSLQQYLDAHQRLVDILDESYNDEQRAENLLKKGMIDLRSPFFNNIGGNND